MIEINLIPDIKQEFLRAKRARTVVMSTAILVGLGSVAVVVLLALYLFLGQAVRSGLADQQINTKSKELSEISDIGNTLTIQQQLSNLSELHNGTNMTSRFFEMLAAINPQAPNNVSFSLARLEAETSTVHLEGQAVNGFNVADTLKKTILSTKLSFRDENDDAVTKPLTTNVSISDLSYGEDSTGKKVLRFTLSFEYDPAFLSRSSSDMIIVRPDRQNVTDSFLHLPESLFSDRTIDQGGSN